jgi:hypothetical protein
MYGQDFSILRLEDQWRARAYRPIRRNGEKSPIRSKKMNMAISPAITNAARRKFELENSLGGLFFIGSFSAYTDGALRKRGERAAKKVECM